MKVGFAGTGTFAQLVWRQLTQGSYPPCLLVTAPAAGRGGARQRAVAPLAALAETAGVPVLAPMAWDAAAIAQVTAADLDCLVVADYGRKLPTGHLPCAINVHPSLLPRWRGAAPVQRALWEGDRYTGVSIIRLTDVIDAGPLYAQSATAISDTEDAGQLSARLAALAGPLLEDVLAAIAQGSAVPTAQDRAGARWARRLQPEEEWLSLGQLSAVSTIRRVRALSPRPGAKATLAGRVVQILSCTPSAVPAPPGAIQASDGQLIVGTVDGSVAVDRLRPASGREMSGADFLRGLRGVWR